MKVKIILIFLIVFIFSSCGKKGDPKYQGTINISESMVKKI